MTTKPKPAGGLTEKQFSNFDAGRMFTRLCLSTTFAEYSEALTYLNANGWDIRRTPRDDDFAAAAEIIGGVA